VVVIVWSIIPFIIPLSLGPTDLLLLYITNQPSTIYSQ
jgi:hypothetical protein